MRSIRKQIIGGAIIIAAVGYLAVTGLGSGWVYYVDVDQYTAQTAATGRRARVFGVVGGNALELNRANLSARFDLVGSTSTLRVDYHGAVPELFQSGRQVVVEGQLGADGVFNADVLLTKCSSKYEGHGRAAREARAAESLR
ncbi:MAG: cytochrome c maturation protein CcmE [Phycisphaerales bacterium]|nr:cytochrome c maturation protein CcmE [Phycisphaerales bacterium]